MVQSFTARIVFEKGIARAQTMLRLHELGCKHGEVDEQFNDAHLAAVVLAISALDAFVRMHVLDTVGEMLRTPKGRPLSKELKEALKELVPHGNLLDALRTDEVHSTVLKALKDNFDTRSFQRADTIVEAFRLIGVQDVMKEVAKGADINEAKMRSKLDQFTKRRHIVVHRGGYDFDQNPPVEHPISKDEVQECIKLVTIIVRHMPGGD